MAPVTNTGELPVAGQTTLVAAPHDADDRRRDRPLERRLLIKLLVVAVDSLPVSDVRAPEANSPMGDIVFVSSGAVSSSPN
ncbi:hypothetical protein C8R46DRAFT_1207144 [Mycena filopes]|nr:hypothetical protein C8R46DRAFT_1207144 [Mycena filopes]